MTLLFILAGIVLGLAGGVALFFRAKTTLVAEDTVAVIANHDGFIKRILPAGRHTLYPLERVAFSLETRTRLVQGLVVGVASSDGIMAKIAWSATYSLKPEAITEHHSQRLRGLQQAERAITRSVDIFLRQLNGVHPVQELFNPSVRQRLERHAGQLVSDKLKPLGIVFNGLNLQTIELPSEVAEALNKAKAIETLDSAIQRIDPTTREVVRGVYQLDELLHWDAYLPSPSRRTMKRLQAMNN